MSPEELAQARGSLIVGLQKANAHPKWMAAIFWIDATVPNKVQGGMCWDDFPYEAVSRGQPEDTLPAINQVIISGLKMSGMKIVKGRQHGGLWIADDGQAGKIIDPTKM